MDLAIYKKKLKNQMFEVLCLNIFLLYIILGSLQVSAGILEKIEVRPINKDEFQLKLGFDSVPPEWKSYILQNPARIIVDLADTDSQVARYLPISKGHLEQVVVAQAGHRTRMVISMDQPGILQATNMGKSLLFTISPFSSNYQNSSVTQKKSKTKLKKVSAKVSSKSSLLAVDFLRNTDGAGNIIFSTSSNNPPIHVVKKGQQLMVDFADLHIPEKLIKKLDVTQFATPVKFITLRNNKKRNIAIIDLAGNYEFLTWQSAKKITISVHEINDKQTAGSGKLSHTGEKLSLNFQNIEIRSVLQLLADEQNFNLVASDTVKGNVTLHLDDVPWDQALDIILRSKGLDKRIEGNVMIVAPAQELASMEQEFLESKQQITELAPLSTELVQINYAKAEEIASILKGTEKNRILSGRGSVQVVERTNSLMISETKEKLKNIRQLITKIDIPVQQVMIEARIVEARTNLRDELGVTWGKAKKSAPTMSKGKHGSIDDMFVSMPVNGANSGITFGYVTNSVNLSLQLTALETDSKVEIISRPQIITANKKKAIIRKGEERAYETVSDNGTNTTFKDVALSLAVTPQITPDGKVVMDVEVNNNEVTGNDKKNNPITSINEIKTQLLVDNGQTVVLGGIFKNFHSKSKEEVPFLSKLPIIGRLFRKNTNNHDKSELLVFITPRIITENLAKK